MVDAYLAVRVVAGDWPDGLPDDDPVLPASRHWRLLQQVHSPSGGQLSRLQLVHLKVNVIETAQDEQVDRGLITRICTLGEEDGRLVLDRPLDVVRAPRPALSRSSSSRPPPVRGRRRSPPPA